MNFLDNVTKLLALRNLQDIPKWAVGAGVVVSFIYLARTQIAQDAIEYAADEYLPPNVKKRVLRTGRAGDNYD